MTRMDPKISEWQVELHDQLQLALFGALLIIEHTEEDETRIRAKSVLTALRRATETLNRFPKDEPAP